MGSVIGVLIIDDHPLVTDGLCAALEADPELSVLGIASSLAEARRELERLRPDVAVVDIRLPDGSGLDLVQPGSAPAWVILTSYGTTQYLRAARRRGAAGFFLKSSPTRALLAGLKQVAAGGSAFDPEIVTRASADSQWRLLSGREAQIVRLVVEGLSNDEIASRLTIARKTVESHLAHLYARLGCGSRTELAVRAEREGWLDLLLVGPSAV